MTGRGREDFQAGFDSGAYRLEVFERWLGGEGRRFRWIVGAPEAPGETVSTGPPASRPTQKVSVASASDRLEGGADKESSDRCDRMVGATGTRGHGRSRTTC